MINKLSEKDELIKRLREINKDKNIPSINNKIDIISLNKKVDK